MLGEQNNIYTFSGAEGLMPKEETLEMTRKKSSIRIGIPRETCYQEKRIPIVPQAIGLLVANGHEVLVENDAGKLAHFTNDRYAEAGAHIVYSPQEVYQAELILKIAPPSIEEIEYFRSRQILISALHLTGQTGEYFKKLIAKRMTAVAFEYIMDKTGSYPIRRSISEIVGSTSILIAAEYLANTTFGKGCMLGGFTGIPPTEVLILGAGTVGEHAARTALGMGANVRVFDNSVYRLRRLQNNLTTRIYTSVFDPTVLARSVQVADVIIGAVHSGNGRTPVIVTEEMVRNMKKGSVIVDVSIDQGGCIETSHPTTHHEPVFKKYDVTHYCVPNIASIVPHTASYAISNYFAPVLLQLGEFGGLEPLLKADKGFRHGVYLFNGTVTKKIISDHFYLPFQDIDLLMAAFH